MTRRLEQHLPVESLPCAAVYVDRAGMILAANVPFEQLWISSGCGADSPVGTEVFSIFAEDDRETVRRALAMRAPARPSVCAATLAGSMTPVVVELAPVQRDWTSHTAWLVMLRPTDVEPWAHDAVREALAAGIFHDLRAPLQVVLGWTSLLKHKHDDETRLEHALTVIERNARLQLDLLADLLELSRPTWARAPLRREPVNLVDLVTAVVRGLEPAADERGLRLLLAIDAASVVVNGRDAHLKRIVTNLVTNALKFTPRGGSVECRLSCSAFTARLVIRDSGRGISEEFLPRVFDPFLQEPAYDPATEGVGLGLCVVRHLVEQHGGTVTAESSGLGHGATFTVLLPAAPPLMMNEGPSPLSREVC